MKQLAMIGSMLLVVALSVRCAHSAAVRSVDQPDTTLPTALLMCCIPQGVKVLEPCSDRSAAT
jgi:hypothetical protein